jgi:hypothetical protein
MDGCTKSTTVYGAGRIVPKGHFANNPRETREAAMRKLLLLLAIAMVFTFTVGAQTPTKADKKADKDNQQTITGCLASNGKFSLTTDEGKKYDIKVKKVLKLLPYVGQEVKLTGTPSEGATPEFKATKVDHVSNTCKSAAAAGAKTEAAPK